MPFQTNSFTITQAISSFLPSFISSFSKYLQNLSIAIAERRLEWCFTHRNGLYSNYVLLKVKNIFSIRNVRQIVIRATVVGIHDLTMVGFQEQESLQGDTYSTSVALGELSMVAHTCNPNVKEAKAGRIVTSS